MSKKCPESVPLPGVSQRCSGHSRNTLGPLYGHSGARDPKRRRHLKGHSRGHSRDTSGAKGPRDSRSRPRGLQSRKRLNSLTKLRLKNLHSKFLDMRRKRVAKSFTHHRVSWTLETPNLHKESDMSSWGLLRGLKVQNGEFKKDKKLTLLKTRVLLHFLFRSDITCSNSEVVADVVDQPGNV